MVIPREPAAELCRSATDTTALTPGDSEHNMTKRRVLILACLVVLLGVCPVASLIWLLREEWEFRCSPIPLSTTFFDESPVTRRVTVKQKLKEIGAECRSGQLYDREGRPIYLYIRSTPENLSPAGKRERQEIARLVDQYHVVVITSPSPPP